MSIIHTVSTYESIRLCKFRNFSLGDSAGIQLKFAFLHRVAMFDKLYKKEQLLIFHTSHKRTTSYSGKKANAMRVSHTSF